MENVWFLASLWVGLALIATLLAIWLKNVPGPDIRDDFRALWPQPRHRLPGAVLVSRRDGHRQRCRANGDRECVLHAFASTVGNAIVRGDRSHCGWRREGGRLNRYVMIALGGALGAIARYQLAAMIQARVPVGFPWG